MLSQLVGLYRSCCCFLGPLQLACFSSRELRRQNDVDRFRHTYFKLTTTSRLHDTGLTKLRLLQTRVRACQHAPSKSWHLRSEIMRGAAKATMRARANESSMSQTAHLEPSPLARQLLPLAEASDCLRKLADASSCGKGEPAFVFVFVLCFSETAI